MKKKVLYTLILGALFISATLTGVMAAGTDASASKSRSGLYSKTPTEKSSSALPSSEVSGLYSPLRAGSNLPADLGNPGLDDGIGTIAPIGEMPGIILFSAAMAYLGFVFVRKQKELRVKN